MFKKSYSSEFDQNDPKMFRETLGTFGTTTKPGANQLIELQAKVRQGVKHVEFNLNSQGKGEFGALDVPDKYGFEQRRTIMQLAKLNQQTLSVHASIGITSFSGLGKEGFDESRRLDSIREIDETIKFASEAAKSGAVVMHLQGDGISTDRGELNLSKSYLDWLKKNKKDEYENIKKNYFDKNYLNRLFVNNPEKEKEVRVEFNSLVGDEKNKYLELERKNPERKAWEHYYIEKNIEKQKLAPDMNPLVMVGDKIEQTQRSQEFINFDSFKKKDFNSFELEGLKKIGITDLNLDLSDFQTTQALFSNGYSGEIRNKLTKEEFNVLKNKLLVTYDKVLENNNFMFAQADKEFHKKLLTTNLEVLNLQKKDIETKYQLHKDELVKIEELERERRNLLKKSDNFNDASEVNLAAKDAIKQDLFKKNKEIQDLISAVGYQEYQEISKYDETIAQLNQKKKEIEEQKNNVKALTDVSFDKNTSTVGHLGIKALKYQLELKEKSKISKEKVRSLNSEIYDLEKKYSSVSSNEERDNINNQINLLKRKLKNWVGVKDYSDIDLINKPLYLAPENMLPGYGSLTSIEEFKALIRMSQEDFAEKIMSNEKEYKILKEKYENETGIKIGSKEEALKLAKRHIGGTFDSAHAGVWLKHFRKIEGESDELRVDRFNSWLNSQAEEMVKEGLVKHVHLNDTLGKDDEHNFVGSGVLDMHDLKKRLRKAGVKEALIVEAGGRGANTLMHLRETFDFFNPGMNYNKGLGDGDFSDISNWMSVSRNYENRPQYSQYGMSSSTFQHQAPKDGQPKGGWSQTNFF